VTGFRWGIKLLGIQLFFIFIVWLSSYFPGMDVFFALFYVAAAAKAGQTIARISGESSPFANLLAAGIIAQLPGFFLGAVNLLYYAGYGFISEDFSFVFQIWHTPFLPFLSFFPFSLADGYAFYFAALFVLSPLYAVILFLPWLLELGVRKRRQQML